MKYKVGDKVKLRDKEGLEKIESQYMGMAFKPEVYELAGTECTIREVVADGYVFDSSPWCWSENMIEGLAEDLTHKEKSSEFPEAVLLNGADLMRALKQVDMTKAITEKTIKEAEEYDKRKERMRELYKGEQWSTEFECPDGYEFLDEKGRVIEAKKIVLEKKKMGYPKSYEECLKVLGYDDREVYCIFHTGADETLFEALYRLKVCRDAYWKIAGKWKLEYPFNTARYVITNSRGFVGKVLVYDAAKNYVLEFPTEEMRDAFYENFKKLIEDCKELL